MDTPSPHGRATSYQSAGKACIPFITEQVLLAQSRHQRPSAAAIYRLLKDQEPPFFGCKPITESSLRRLVVQIKAQLAQAAAESEHEHEHKHKQEYEQEYEQEPALPQEFELEWWFEL